MSCENKFMTIKKVDVWSLMVHHSAIGAFTHSEYSFVFLSMYMVHVVHIIWRIREVFPTKMDDFLEKFQSSSGSTRSMSSLQF